MCAYLFCGKDSVFLAAEQKKEENNKSFSFFV